MKQRQIFLSGADPYAKLSNPFTRSVGALAVRKDVNFHTPGGGNVRGFNSHISGSQLYGFNAELERPLLTRSGAGLFNRIAAAVFGDAALSDASTTPGGGIADALGVFADAGVGLRIRHRIGQTTFLTRFDLPLYVNRPALANRALNDEMGFRWVVAVSPAF